MKSCLYIGNRRYSSSFMRRWVVPLGMTESSVLVALSPSGLVPVLEHDGLVNWDSLAICEYCAEMTPAIWPSSRTARVIARSITAEMHAGFRDLRQLIPMNLGRTAASASINPLLENDIHKIDQIWQRCLAVSGGPFLFGEEATVPDAVFARVVSRFISYDRPLSDVAAEYVATVPDWNLIDNWYRLAAAEPVEWRLAKYE